MGFSWKESITMKVVSFEIEGDDDESKVEILA